MIFLVSAMHLFELGRCFLCTSRISYDCRLLFTSSCCHPCYCSKKIKLKKHYFLWNFRFFFYKAGLRKQTALVQGNFMRNWHSLSKVAQQWAWDICELVYICHAWRIPVPKLLAYVKLLEKHLQSNGKQQCTEINRLALSILMFIVGLQLIVELLQIKVFFHV